MKDDWYEVGRQVYDLAWGKANVQVWRQVRNQVWDRVSSQISGQIKGQVAWSVRLAVYDELTKRGE